MKHTPAPWRIKNQAIFGPNEYICSFSGRSANARLIAAAPELLEALKGIAEEGCCLSPGCSMDDPMCTAMIARAAIEKARQ